MGLEIAVLIAVVVLAAIVVFLFMMFWILIAFALLTPTLAGPLPGDPVAETSAQVGVLTTNPCPSCAAIQARWNALPLYLKVVALPAYVTHQATCSMAGCPLTLGLFGL